MVDSLYHVHGGKYASPMACVGIYGYIYIYYMVYYVLKVLFVGGCSSFLWCKVKFQLQVFVDPPKQKVPKEKSYVKPLVVTVPHIIWTNPQKDLEGHY